MSIPETLRTDRRDNLQETLQQKGIQTGIHYAVPAHLQPAYADLGYARHSLPQSEKAAEEVLSLPLYPEMTEDQIETVARAFPDVPLLFNYAEGGKTPAVDLSRLAELGFAVVIFPISTLLAATGAMRQVLARIRADGTPRAVLDELPSFTGFLDFIGLPEIRDLERRYAAEEVPQ